MMKITLSQVVLIRSEIVLANEGAIHFLKEWNTHQAKHHAHRRFPRASFNQNTIKHKIELLNLAVKLEKPYFSGQGVFP